MLGLDETLFNFSRYYLACFFTFVAGFYTIRILWLQKTQNKTMIYPGERYCATWWNHCLFRLFRASIWLICLARAVQPSADNYLGLINSLNQWSIISSGLVLLTGGFGFTLYSHFQMNTLWRSGIDPNSPKQLITTGIYAYSRNPMFIGVITAQLGFFLALPSLFTLVCLVVGVNAVYRQLLAEEQSLREKFGEVYLQFCQHVPRWW